MFPFSADCMFGFDNPGYGICVVNPWSSCYDDRCDYRLVLRSIYWDLYDGNLDAFLQFVGE